MLYILVSMLKGSAAFILRLNAVLVYVVIKAVYEISISVSKSTVMLFFIIRTRMVPSSIIVSPFINGPLSQSKNDSQPLHQVGH
jgi:hypothetical protein